MLRSERSLGVGDEIPEHGFGFGVVFITHQSVRQVVAVNQGVWMLGAEDLFFQGNDLSILNGRVGVFALGLERVGQA